MRNRFLFWYLGLFIDNDSCYSSSWFNIPIFPHCLSLSLKWILPWLIMTLRFTRLAFRSCLPFFSFLFFIYFFLFLFLINWLNCLFFFIIWLLLITCNSTLWYILIRCSLTLNILLFWRRRRILWTILFLRHLQSTLYFFDRNMVLWWVLVVWRLLIIFIL